MDRGSRLAPDRPLGRAALALAGLCCVLALAAAHGALLSPDRTVTIDAAVVDAPAPEGPTYALSTFPPGGPVRSAVGAARSAGAGTVEAEPARLRGPAAAGRFFVLAEGTVVRIVVRG